MEQATVFDLVESRAIKKESLIRINRKETQVLALKKGQKKQTPIPIFQFFLAYIQDVRSFSFDRFEC